MYPRVFTLASLQNSSMTYISTNASYTLMGRDIDLSYFLISATSQFQFAELRPIEKELERSGREWKMLLSYLHCPKTRSHENYARASLTWLPNSGTQLC
jgi:hypothetical protein